MHSSAVVVFDDDLKVLLLRRSSTDPWSPGWWNCPGGYLEPGETPLEAALRELREETGIVPAPAREPIAIAPIRLGDHTQFGFAVFLDEKRPPITMADGEHDEYRWCSPRGRRRKLVDGSRRLLRLVAHL